MSVYGLTSSRIVSLRSAVRSDPDSVEIERRPMVLYKATNLVVGTLHECELNVIIVQTKSLVEWRWVFLLDSYCCYHVKSKDRS